MLVQYSVLSCIDFIEIFIERVADLNEEKSEKNFLCEINKQIVKFNILVDFLV